MYTSKETLLNVCRWHIDHPDQNEHSRYKRYINVNGDWYFWSTQYNCLCIERYMEDNYEPYEDGCPKELHNRLVTRDLSIDDPKYYKWSEK